MTSNYLRRSIRVKSNANRAYSSAFGELQDTQRKTWVYSYSDTHNDYFENKDTGRWIKCLKESKE